MFDENVDEVVRDKKFSVKKSTNLRIIVLKHQWLKNVTRNLKHLIPRYAKAQKSKQRTEELKLILSIIPKKL
ncbi:hypothetical protein GWI33_012067 [Rhynchophorus ferrugineus]|uniref:Uncharacterized protein n=1 Tax=Rhynchophorus ferrugineus TaxID=354439 RepID=A0A834IAU4_RHYFE|nr:hypothetical protein GWI33_012067 [Rhynchophorus ferrugineus]